MLAVVVAMLVTLSVPTFVLWRRRGETTRPRRAHIVMVGTGWTFAGVLLALVIALLLDLLRVPFIPVR